MSKVKDGIKSKLGKKEVKAEVKEVKEEVKEEKKSDNLFFCWEDLKQSTKDWLKEVKETDNKIAARLGYAYEHNESATMADVTRECGDSCYSAFARLIEAGLAYKIPSGRAYKMGFKTSLSKTDKAVLDVLQPKSILDANAKINDKQAKLVASLRKSKK